MCCADKIVMPAAISVNPFLYECSGKIRTGLGLSLRHHTNHILRITEKTASFELLGKTHISDDFVSAHRSEHIPLPVYGNDIIIIRIIRVDFPA